MRQPEVCVGEAAGRLGLELQGEAWAAGGALVVSWYLKSWGRWATQVLRPVGERKLLSFPQQPSGGTEGETEMRDPGVTAHRSSRRAQLAGRPCRTGRWPVGFDHNEVLGGT